MSLFKDMPLKTEAIAYHEFDVEKYRRKIHKSHTYDEYVKKAENDHLKEIGIYTSSKDWTKETIPSFLCNIHLTFSDTFAGKTIEERPSSFFILGVQNFSKSLPNIEKHITDNLIDVLRGGIWENRLYEQHGASIEWAYRNYPISRSNCSLKDWKPNFDIELTQQSSSIGPPGHSDFEQPC